jgi:hypothetical protein
MMPDLRTEMLKTIQVWNKDTNMQKTDMSFGEQVFEWVKANPNASLTDAKKFFPKQNDSAISTTLKTLYDRGMIDRREVVYDNYSGVGRKTYFKYFAIHDKYETINKGYWKPKNAVVKVKKPTNEYKPPVRRPVEPQDFSFKPAFNAEQVVQSLNLYQAKEVYQLLRAVFESKL